MNRDQAQEALQHLTTTYGQLLGQAVDLVLEKDDAAGAHDLGYAWEEREERLAARLRNLQILIGSLQQALAQPAEPRIWVESFELDHAGVAQGINERLATCGDELPVNISFQPGEDGKVTVLLTFRVDVPASPS